MSTEEEEEQRQKDLRAGWIFRKVTQAGVIWVEEASLRNASMRLAVVKSVVHFFYQ